MAKNETFVRLFARWEWGDGHVAIHKGLFHDPLAAYDILSDWIRSLRDAQDKCLDLMYPGDPNDRLHLDIVIDRYPLGG